MATSLSPKKTGYSLVAESKNKLNGCEKVDFYSSHQCSYNSNKHASAKLVVVEKSPPSNLYRNAWKKDVKDGYSDPFGKQNKKYSTPWEKYQEYQTPKSYKVAENNKNIKLKGPSNGSTLSIHIANYENSIEAQSIDDGKEDKVAIKKFNPGKLFQSCPSSTEKDYFEIPRQQKDEPTAPQVMQFKASQKLLDHNQLALVPPGSSVRFIRPIRVPLIRLPGVPVLRPQIINSNIRNPVVSFNSNQPSKATLKKPPAIGYKEEAKKINQEHSTKSISTDKDGDKSVNVQKDIKINVPKKDTKRKDEWDNPEVLRLIDNFILNKSPSKISKLISLLLPYFGKVGRSTRKKLKNGKKTPVNKNIKITRFLNKKEDSKIKADIQKKPFVEKIAEEVIKECAPPKADYSDDTDDTEELLNRMINSIQNQLHQAQTAENSAKLVTLLKRLTDAKEEYLKNNIIPSIEHDYNVDLSFDLPEAPCINMKVPRGKKRMKNYYFGYNEKLKKNLLIIYENKNNVREFSLEKSRNGTSYYTCSRCRSNHDHHFKHSNGEPAKQCRAIVLPNGEVFVDIYHAKSCGAIPKVSSDAWQARRMASMQAANGAKTKAAFDAGFKESLGKNAFMLYGNYSSRLNNLSRWRGKNIPECAKGNIKQHYQNLFNLKRRWLLEDANDVVLFATDTQLRVMAEASIIAVDSTFSVTPRGFKQTFFCHSLIESDEGEHWVVTAMALMENKDEKSYSIIFDAIKKKWKEMGVTPRFERIHADYEEAQSNALKRAFGEDKIKGCLFHYNQCVLRYIGERGLYPFYNLKKSGKPMPENHRRIRTWIRSLMALPLLPKEDCREFAKILCRPPPKPENVNDNEWPTVALQEVADYMQKEWLSKTDEMWNFNNLRRVRNSNRCEGFHSALKKMLDEKPKLKIFLKDMQLLSTEIEAEIEGIQQNRQKAYRSKKYALLDEKLMYYEELFRNDIKEAKTNTEKNFIRFRHCRRVSYLLHEIRNKSCNTVKSAKKAHKSETLRAWKDDLQYIFDKEKDHDSWIKWMEEEEDLMISRGDMKDDLDDIVNESLSLIDDKKEFTETDLSLLLSFPPSNPNASITDGNNMNHSPLSSSYQFSFNCSPNLNRLAKSNIFHKNVSPHRIEYLKPGEVKSPSPPVKEFNIDATAPISPIKNVAHQVKAEKNVKISDHQSHMNQPKPGIIDGKWEEEDGMFVLPVLKAPKKRMIRRMAKIQNIQLEGIFGNLIPAKLYDCIVPPSTAYTQSELFIPPDLQQLQHYLLLLDLPPDLAYGSPLLASVAVEPEGRSIVTINTRGDGNCGHRSLSTLLTGSETYHWHIRIKIFEHIAANGLQIYGIRSANLANEYHLKAQQLKNMAPQRVDADLYAGNDDFFALADMLECNVYTYTPNPHGFNSHISPHFKNNIKTIGAPTFFLMYINDNHYEPIINFM